MCTIISHRVPSQDFGALEPYSPVKPLEVLAAEIGVSIENLVKLDANENLYGPLPQVRIRYLGLRAVAIPSRDLMRTLLVLVLVPRLCA